MDTWYLFFELNGISAKTGCFVLSATTMESLTFLSDPSTRCAFLSVYLKIALSVKLRK